MKRKTLLALLFLVLLVVACGKQNPEATEGIGYPSPDGQSAYPSANELLNASTVPWYPAPGTPGAPAPGMAMTTGLEPRPGDANLPRAEAFLDRDTSQLLILESLPLQVYATLNGNLPNSCHWLRVAVTAADASNHVNLEVYSLVNSTENCTQELKPFSVSIPLGTYSGGHFSVYVNGELLGEFDS